MPFEVPEALGSQAGGRGWKELIFPLIIQTRMSRSVVVPISRELMALYCTLLLFHPADFTEKPLCARLQTWLAAATGRCLEDSLSWVILCD